MKRKLIVLFSILVFIILLIFYSIQTFVVLPQNDTLDLEYKIVIDSFNSSLLKVELKIKNIKTDRLELREYGYNGHENSLNSIKAFDRLNKPLSVKSLPKLESDSRTMDDVWQIECNNQNNINIVYEKDLNSIEENEYPSIISDNFGSFLGAQAIILPVNSNLINNNIRFKFIVPNKSEIVIPWHKTFGYYYPAKGGTLYEPTSSNFIKYLLNNIIALGDFNVHSENIGKVKFMIAAPKSIDNQMFESIINDTTCLFEYYTNLFGNIDEKSYVVILFNNNQTKKFLRSEWVQSQSDTLVNNKFNIRKVSHQLFHRWAGWEYGWSEDKKEFGDFLSEGVARYYESKSVITLSDKLKTVDKSDFLPLSEVYKKYRSAPSTETAPFNSEKADTFTKYEIGSILNLYLDTQIITDTKSKYSLDDVLKGLWLRHKNKNGLIRKGELISIINQLTEKNYDGFYNTLMDKNTLNLDNLFEDSDFDSIPNFIEFLQNTSFKDNTSFNKNTRSILGGM